MATTELANIVVYPHIEAVHQQGVQAARQGRIREAEGLYHAAQELVYPLTDYAPHDASADLHAARILRDHGLLGVRAHMLGVDDAEYAAGVSDGRLEESRTITEVLLADKAEFDEKAVGRLYAEHGATISCQARVLIYRCLASDDRPTFQTAKIIRDFLAEAHEALRYGNNAYYGASNAMRAAAFERTLGHSEMGGWLAKAAGFVTTPFGLSDFGDACRTTASVGLALRSNRAARKLVLSRP